MKGGFLIIVAFATTLVTVFAHDTPILPIPTDCPDTDSPERTVHIKHENDCTKFYKCLGGEKILMDCPFMDKAKTQRLHFNALLQVCDFPSKANCNIIPSPPPTTPNTTKNCENSPVGTNIPHETRCHLYYKCVAYGKQQLLECAQGSYFNPHTQVCDTSNRCQLTNHCRYHRKPEGDFYPHPTSCTYVIYCKGNDIEIIFSCDENSEWSTDQKQCMKPDLANCTRKPNYYK